MAILRLTPAGSFDSTFSGDGKTTLKVPGHNFSGATGVAIQSGGKIVVGGYAGGSDGDSDDNFVLARYLSNGNLDKTFGAAKNRDRLIRIWVIQATTNDGALIASSAAASQYLIEGGIFPITTLHWPPLRRTEFWIPVSATMVL